MPTLGMSVNSSCVYYVSVCSLAACKEIIVQMDILSWNLLYFDLCVCFRYDRDLRDQYGLGVGATYSDGSVRDYSTPVYDASGNSYSGNSAGYINGMSIVCVCVCVCVCALLDMIDVSFSIFSTSHRCPPSFSDLFFLKVLTSVG